MTSVSVWVGGPSGVGDAGGGGGSGFVDHALQVGDFADGLDDLDAAIVLHGDAGGVIAAVLEALEGLEDDGAAGFGSDVSGDSAHKALLGQGQG